MAPILHLSLPVRDLAETRTFYAGTLGCAIGRERDDFIDVWFYGMQVSMHAVPAEVVPSDRQGVRHFGVTLTAPELAALVERLADRPVEWRSPLSTDYAGTPQEQTKAKLADPSGNVIEIKAYAHPEAALERPPTTE